MDLVDLTRVVDVIQRRLPDLEHTLRTPERELSDDDARLLAARIANDEFDLMNQQRIRQERPRLSTDERDELRDEALAAVFGLGGIQKYLDDPDVENVDINGHDQVFVTYSNGSVRHVPPVAPTDRALVEVIQNGARRLGLGEQRWDTADPILDLHLPDGSRLHAVLGGKTERGVSPIPGISIRRHRYSDLDLDDLQRLGTVDDTLVAFLRAAVRAERTILVSGGTNTGKTTTLRALCHEIPAHERLVTVEKDLLELGLFGSKRHPNVFPLHSRVANVEGVGGVSVAELVRTTLRMNPGRVIVGEVLGDEVLPMLNAMSQGNDGSMCTIHSDSSAGVFHRLASYAVQAPTPLPPASTYMLVAGAVHLVVHLHGDRAEHRPMRRRVVSVREITGMSPEGRVASTEIFAAPTRTGEIARPSGPISDGLRERLAGFGYTAEDHTRRWAS